MRIHLEKLIKSELEQLLENCNFNDEETEIVIMKSKSYSCSKICYELGISESTLYRKICKIDSKIKKYKGEC